MKRYSSIPWHRTIQDLEHCFEKWGVEDWQTRPMRPGKRTLGLTPDERRVRVDWTTADGRAVQLSCDAHGTPSENLRALYLGIDGLRLNEVRGLSEMHASVYAQLASGAEKAAHEVLGIGEDASAEVRRAAYKALAKIHHPDVEGGDAAKFREIEAAYRELEGRE